MAIEQLKKFGKYFLLDELAQGGMAEIYRARQKATEGLGRIVVIKRIQAGFDGNHEFIKMFKDEINVSMGFNHPNVVQLFDFGEEQNQLFIAMEFVDGRNVRQFLNKFNERKEPFPIELAVHIVEQAAAGLHYAHSYRDKISGQLLNIVHRDISPQNILISYDGGIKVIDFGIAKATTNSEATRAGVIKGKPSYLSPEQISGEVLDGRSDLFALGIVLWEVLVGKKLFQGENDLAILKMIESCNTHVKPPSQFNPRVPKELDMIVLKSLAKQREKRFQTAGEFNRELHKFLYKFSPDFSPEDLSQQAKELFQTEIVEDRKKIQRLNEKLEQLLATDPAGVPELDSSPTKVLPQKPSNPSSDDQRAQPVKAREQTIIDLKSIQPSRIELEGSPQMKNRGLPSRSSTQFGQPTNTGLTGSGSFQGAVVGTGSITSQLSRAPQQDYGASKSAVKILAASILGVIALGALGPQVGFRLPVISDFFSPAPITQVQEPVTQPIRSVSSGEVVANQSSEGKIALKLTWQPIGRDTKVTLNGAAVDAASATVVVSLDTPLNIVAERVGYKRKEIDFVIQKNQIGQSKEWPYEIQLEPEKQGFLSIRSSPSADIRIQIGNDEFIKKTPIENERVPAGHAVIVFENNLLQMGKKVQVDVQESKTVVVDERLDAK